eukprot:CAMPEP_0184036560 /NCGR_PEP_ID=MMETSP0955-20130417/33087_1 /TAXON_ID=627963 /ORGANISM="Aplanochytrium sp, Strain PBS07" /LENGTH=33 /DNA_ID= /DNA_START= /DNA_END= /DNA_ORIENTATION=
MITFKFHMFKKSYMIHALDAANEPSGESHRFHL